MGEEDPALEASLTQAKEKFDGLLAAVDEICAISGKRGTKATRQHAAPRKRKWWPCSTGGATSAIWSAT